MQLTYHKHRLENNQDIDQYQEVLERLTETVDRLGLLLLRPEERQVMAAEIDPATVKFDPTRDKLGEGTYGTVYRANCAGALVAVKVPRQTEQLPEARLRMFKREANIMARVLHQNIVQFLGACFQPRNLMIVTALMSTDLSKLIHSSSVQLTMGQKLKLAYESALGVNWLHTICQMIHRDLKPDNVLVDDHMVAHITDFGFTELLRGKSNRDESRAKGTMLYMAPEVMQRKDFDCSSDVYSYGIILYELFTGRYPYENHNDVGPFYRAVCFSNERPPIRALAPQLGLPKSLGELAEQCWDPEPRQRPTMEQVLGRLATSTIDYFIPLSSPTNEYWKRQFTQPVFYPVVTWKQMQAALQTTVRAPPALLERLESHVGERATGAIPQYNVTMERFQRYYLWFGRWFESPGEPLIDEMVQLFEAPWYHDEIDMTQAAARLNQRPVGTFLVRLSLKDYRSPFTISFAGKEKPEHTRITRVSYNPGDEHRYQLQPYGAFRTVNQLIDHLVNMGLLAGPCPREIARIAY